VEHPVPGFPVANRREARKLGLLRSKSSEAETASGINQPTTWARRGVSSGFARRGGDRVPACGCTDNWNRWSGMSVFAGKRPAPDAHPARKTAHGSRSLAGSRPDEQRKFN